MRPRGRRDADGRQRTAALSGSQILTDPIVIYDFGANNGDDIPYYLLKADRVVAVEANPVLAAEIERRFAEVIATGQLEVITKVLTADQEPVAVPFYLHRANHVLSQFPPPDDPADFERIVLPSIPVVELIARFGAPHYVKIDIEHYDEAILRALFAAGIRPPLISAEAHSFEVFAGLVALGGYRAFKLVDGITVPQRYRDHPIATPGGPARHSFPEHSAGPFGDDIPGPWLSTEAFMRLLAAEGFGWKDIHATSLHPADVSAGMNREELGLTIVRRWARARLRRLVRGSR